MGAHALRTVTIVTEIAKSDVGSCLSGPGQPCLRDKFILLIIRRAWSRYQRQTYPLPFIQKDSHVCTFQAVLHRIWHSSTSCKRCRSVFWLLYQPSVTWSTGCGLDIEPPHPVNIRKNPVHIRAAAYLLNILLWKCIFILKFQWFLNVHE